MAEAGKEKDKNEIDMMEGEENNGALSHNSNLPNTSLAELNMLLVLLSLFYFSSDECMEYKNSVQKAKEEVALTKTKTKTCVSRLQSKRRGKHEPKLVRKPISTRFQTAIKDSRHGRKM
ncbi:hypothetical protein VNO78_18584 [Psophocarpus tetragonolobus]|uniref:Uncharacterized protein n=1 Tax=Psophocarpus tetragonolobus TaxID=3891 RepID=A0AAN9SIP2_PSOTE